MAQALENLSTYSGKQRAESVLRLLDRLLRVRLNRQPSGGQNHHRWPSSIAQSRGQPRLPPGWRMCQQSSEPTYVSRICARPFIAAPPCRVVRHVLPCRDYRSEDMVRSYRAGNKPFHVLYNLLQLSASLWLVAFRGVGAH